MIELEHVLPEPTELSDYRRQHPHGSWDDPGFSPIRPIVRRQLNVEQEGLCIYCESRLTEDDGHVEHIQSKGLNPALTFVYDNLAHSCNEPGHCGHHKQKKVLPVEPRPGCNRFFALMTLDGRLTPAPGLTDLETQQSADTLSILNLNAPALAWQRKGYADTLRYLADPVDMAAFIADQPFRWSLKGLNL